MSNIITIENFSGIDIGALKLDEPIWRYMPYYRFRQLLQNRSLYFASPFQFDDDKFEGVPKRVHIITDFPGHTPDRGWAIGLLEGHIRTAKISCWHIGEQESTAMWKIYAKSLECRGVAIKTSLDRLKGSFTVPSKNDNCDSKPPLLHFRRVDYSDRIANVHNGTGLQSLIFKRPEYSFENELRLIVTMALNDDEQRKGVLVRVDLKNLIEEVILSPGADGDYENIVIADLRNSGLTDVSVTRSFADSDIEFEFTHEVRQNKLSIDIPPFKGLGF